MITVSLLVFGVGNHSSKEILTKKRKALVDMRANQTNRLNLVAVHTSTFLAWLALAKITRHENPPQLDEQDIIKPMSTSQEMENAVSSV